MFKVYFSGIIIDSFQVFTAHVTISFKSKSIMNTDANFYFGLHYHVYNRTNHKEKLFLSDENRRHFLKRYKHYLGDFLDIHAYALIKNHFHFSDKIKTQHKIETHLQQLSENENTITIHNYLDSYDKESVSNDLIIGQHQRFFISYAQADNKMHHRKGNLLHKNFKKSVFNPEKKVCLYAILPSS